MHQGFTRAAGLAILCLAGVAHAQYDDGAIVEGRAFAPLDAEGLPMGGLAASPLSYAIWYESGGWRGRMTAGDAPTRFSGSIHASFGLSDARAMSASLPLQATATAISFDFVLTTGQSGFDFKTPPGSCLDFKL